jgi:ADP-ribosylglycohydrolase
MKNPNPKMMLRIAQGDAFAAAAEFIGDKEHLYKFDKFYQHPGHLKLKPGSYTDDTQMSIGNAEVLCNTFPEFKQTTSDLDFANAWVDAFKRDERDGYARGFQAFLESLTDGGKEFLKKIRPTSSKNGAAMRAVPLGVIPSIPVLINISDQQARLTHDTFGGIFSSRVVALASHYALYSERPLCLVDKFIEEWIEHDGFILGEHGYSFEEIFYSWMGRVPCDGIATAKAVLTLFRHYDNLMDMMRQTVLWGGDTDSVASIAWGVASARYNDELPEFFTKDLEVGCEYGVEYLEDLGEKLMQAYVES